MKTFDLTVSRTISGSADEVFDVWLDAKSPGGLWFGVERAIVNPVVDGLFYHSVKHEGRSWAHYGRFIRLDRGRTTAGSSGSIAAARSSTPGSPRRRAGWRRS